MLLWDIILLVVLLFLSAFFAGVEVAIVSVSKIELRSWIIQKKKGVEALKKLKENTKYTIITILIGNVIVNTWVSALATVIATDLVGSTGLGIAVGVITFLVLVFGDITPKSYAASNYEKLSLRVAKLLLILMRIFTPIIWFLNILSGFLLRILGIKNSKKIISENELKVAFDIGVEDEVIDIDEQTLLKKILEFDDIKVQSVMTTFENIFSLEESMKIEEAIPLISKSRFSRFPLYKDDKSNIVGIIHLKDVLESVAENKVDLTLKKLAVKPLFIPSSFLVDNILRFFQKKHMELGIVINEEKKVVGLVTIEDLLEEIFGEIIDDTDVLPNQALKFENNIFLVHGNSTPQYLKSAFNVNIPGEFQNLSDYLINYCRQIPVRGQIIKINNFSFRIEDVGNNYIKRVLIKKIS